MGGGFRAFISRCAEATIPHFALLAIVATLAACGGGGGGGGGGSASAPPAPGGASTLAVVTSLLANATCPNGGQTINYGIDDNRNGILDPEEIDGSVTICNGAPGAVSLVTMTTEPAGPNCTYGGLKIDAGEDLDSNGVLDDGEITLTRYVCNGAPAGSQPIGTLVSIEVVPLAGAILPGQTVFPIARGTFSDKSTADISAAVRWQSSDETVATTNAITGRVTGINPGFAYITAIEPQTGLIDWTQVAVAVGSAGPAAPGTGKLGPLAATIGMTQSLHYLLAFNDIGGKLTLPPGTVVWASSNPDVATVDATGLATAVSPGTTTISATVFLPGQSVAEVVQVPLTVQTTPLAPLSQVDWISSFVELLEAQSDTAPGGFDPYASANLTLVSLPFPGITATFRTGYNPDFPDQWTNRLDLGFAGKAPGVYDLAKNAVATGWNHLIENLPPFKAKASSGNLIVTRVDAVGGRVEGFLDANFCIPNGPCGRVQGAYSARREANDLLADQGAPGQPIALTVDVNYAGRVALGSSYYTVPVLENTPYIVNVRGVTSDVSVSAFTDSAFTVPFCASNNPGTASESCTEFTPPGTTALYLRVDYVGAGAGALYSVSVDSTPFKSEGTLLSPVQLMVDPRDPIGISYPGQVDWRSSYYQLLPVTTGAGVTVQLLPQGNDGNPETPDVPVLHVYSDAGLSVPFCATAIDSQENMTCAAFVSGVSSLYIRVDGANTGVGAFYLLNAAVLSDEGTQEVPLDLTANVSAPGMVGNGVSYYRLPVTPGLTYDVTLTGLSGDANLTVYADAFATPACQSANSGAADEICTVPATDTSLYIAVDGSATAAGAKYLLLGARRFASEGTVDVPVALAVETWHSGTVAPSGTSFYTFPVTPGGSYTVTLVNGSDSAVTLTLLSALGNVCDKDLITPGMMTVCTYTLPDKDPSTQLLVTVAGDFGAGAAYALGWIAAIYVDDSQPIIVPSIPDTEPGHQVGPGGISTYGVSFPLPGIPVTLTVSQPTDDVSVEVWDTKNNLLCSSDQPGTTDETCSFTVPNDNSTIVYVSGAKTIGGAGYTLLLSPQ